MTLQMIKKVSVRILKTKTHQGLTRTPTLRRRPWSWDSPRHLRAQDQPVTKALSLSLSSEALHNERFQSPMFGNSGPPEWEVSRKASVLVEVLVQNETQLEGHPMLDEYRKHCEWSLARFGCKARAWLLDINHFQEFVYRFKKDEDQRWSN